MQCFAFRAALNSKSGEMMGNKPVENRGYRFPTGWIFLIIIILFIVFVRVRFLEVPLERDEGEYAYMGQLLLEGVPPYSAAYNMKFPGVYLMYALIMAVFGQTVQGIHLGLLAVNCLTVLFIFFLCKILVNDFAALIASGAYAILSLSPSIPGSAAHATHFVALAAVSGSLFLLSAVKKNKPHLFFLSGTMFGLALLMKQPEIFFAAFGVTYVLSRFFSFPPARFLKESPSNRAHRKRMKIDRLISVETPSSSLNASPINIGGILHKGFSRENVLSLMILIMASLLPLLIAVIWLYTAGVFDKFWFWTVKYATKYGAQVPLSEAFEYFKLGLGSVVDGFWFLWIVSGIGLLVTIFHRSLKDSRLFIILFFIFSFLSICPGFYFREHYFITLLPAISILIGIFFNYLNATVTAFFKEPRLQFLPIGIFAAMILVGVIDQKDYFLHDDPVTVSKKIYGNNPFLESVDIARFIAARSSPTDKIAVFGSEPQIYFYAKRRSATGYIYSYALMEIHDYALTMQHEMIKEIEAAKPKFIVDVHTPASWLIRPESEKFIFGWVGNYLRNGYVMVGIVDIKRPGATVYKWNADIKNYAVQSPSFVLIYERV
jgi:hypothetical protein